ncbi:hypothetical protein C1X67_30520, partial [Pseudomonas sp. FW305-62]|uniref:tetratricopeptide repeat protein n=1 Tax=Pseudomonas sp. FW305-62 TaxID=2070641 RepID=UPI000CBA2961
MVWVTLGTVLSDAGKFNDAVTFYEEALRLNPGDPKAHYNLSGVQFALGQVDEAISRCLEAIPLARQPLEGTMMRFSVGVMSLS